MAITTSACRVATHFGVLPTTTNSGDLSPQWTGVFGACDMAEISPRDDNSARSKGSQNTSPVDVD